MAKTQAERLVALRTRQDKILDEIADLELGDLGSLPNTSGTGDHIDHQGYLKGKYEELDRIAKLIEQFEGPYESHSRGRLT